MFAANASVTEGNSGLTALTFTVSLSWASATPVRVYYGTAIAGTDYVAAGPGAYVESAPGQTTQTITIYVKGDTTNDADETFTLFLYADAANTDLIGFATDTILNDDSPGGGKKK